MAMVRHLNWGFLGVWNGIFVFFAVRALQSGVMAVRKHVLAGGGMAAGGVAAGVAAGGTVGASPIGSTAAGGATGAEHAGDTAVKHGSDVESAVAGAAVGTEPDGGSTARHGSSAATRGAARAEAVGGVTHLQQPASQEDGVAAARAETAHLCDPVTGTSAEAAPVLEAQHAPSAASPGSDHAADCQRSCLEAGHARHPGAQPCSSHQVDPGIAKTE
eukprot:357374-Chlamydomonas_euryale.AAC.3